MSISFQWITFWLSKAYTKCFSLAFSICIIRGCAPNKRLVTFHVWFQYHISSHYKKRVWYKSLRIFWVFIHRNSNALHMNVIHKESTKRRQVKWSSYTNFCKHWHVLKILFRVLYSSLCIIYQSKLEKKCDNHFFTLQCLL